MHRVSHLLQLIVGGTGSESARRYVWYQTDERDRQE